MEKVKGFVRNSMYKQVHEAIFFVVQMFPISLSRYEHDTLRFCQAGQKVGLMLAMASSHWLIRV